LKKSLKITLHNKITILKILTVITFLFVTIPGDIWLPMWWEILAGMADMGSLQGVLSIIIAGTVIFIFISSFQCSKINNWFTLLAITALYLPIVFTVAFTIKFSFKYKHFFPLFTYDIFITISLITVSLIIRRLRKG
jgi:hypothetical protein